MTKEKYFVTIALDVKRKPKERIIAINRIDNQRVLNKIATHDNDAKIRFEAVKRITKERYLKSIARYDEKMHIKIAAVERIKDSYLLYQIAKDHKKYDSAVRKRAFELQTNATYIKELSANEFVKKGYGLDKIVITKFI